MLAWQENDLVELKRIYGCLGNVQVAEMNRVKGSSKEADLHVLTHGYSLLAAHGFCFRALFKLSRFTPIPQQARRSRKSDNDHKSQKNTEAGLHSMDILMASNLLVEYILNLLNLLEGIILMLEKSRYYKKPVVTKSQRYTKPFSELA